MQLSARIARLADLADPGVQTAQEVLSGLNGTSRVVPRFCGDFGMCTAILVPGGAQIRGRRPQIWVILAAQTGHPADRCTTGLSEVSS